MSIERDFWSNMVEAVKANTDLKYVKRWIDGARYTALIPNEMPCVIFQPVMINEDFALTTGRMFSQPMFRVIGILRATDMDNAIAGDSRNTGILKLDEDIKNALDDHLTASVGSRVYRLRTASFELPESIQAGNNQVGTLVCVIECEIQQNILFTLGER